MDENAVSTQTTEAATPATDTTVLEPTPVAAAPAETPAPQTSAPEADYRAMYEKQAQELTAFREHYSQSTQAQQEQFKKLQDLMVKTFLPEHYQQQQQQPVVTVDQMQGAFQKFKEEQEASLLVRQFTNELGTAKEKYPDLFDAYPNVDDAIKSAWAKSDKSVVQIAKEMDAAMSKAWEKRQAKYIADKDKTKQVTQATPRAGGTSPKNGADSGLKGWARVSAALRRGVEGAD